MEGKTGQSGRGRKIPEKFEDHTEKAQKFIMYRARGKSIHDAFTKCGYSVVGKGWQNQAYILNRRYARLIKEKIFDSISEHAVEAKDTVLELMRDLETPANVRLACAKEIMTKAGWDMPIELRIDDARSMDDRELNGEITALLEAMKSEEPKGLIIESTAISVTH